jgi:hypothetical protein
MEVKLMVFSRDEREELKSFRTFIQKENYVLHLKKWLLNFASANFSKYSPRS